MKKISLIALFVALVSFSANATDLWSGSKHVSWSDGGLQIAATEFASAVAGQKIVVTFADASDGIEFKVMNENFDHLAGSREAAWIINDGIYEQFLTPAAVSALKSYGLEIIGANFTATKVELLDGKELKDGLTIWTGFFWADSWNTMELYREAYADVDWTKISAIRFYSEAGGGDYVLNLKSSWEDDGHIADRSNMTDGEGFVELTLTDDMRTKLADAPHLMVQFNKESGLAFNFTDIVLVEIANDETSALSAIENDLLPADAAVYNILGQRVNRDNNQRGIFIINGKKVMIR